MISIWNGTFISCSYCYYKSFHHLILTRLFSAEDAWTRFRNSARNSASDSGELVTSASGASGASGVGVSSVSSPCARLDGLDRRDRHGLTAQSPTAMVLSTRGLDGWDRRGAHRDDVESTTNRLDATGQAPWNTAGAASIVKPSTVGSCEILSQWHNKSSSFQ